MNFTDILKQRRSIRDFKDEGVEKEIIQAIVSDAQLAPSWANTQPWKVYVATGETMASIREQHAKQAQEGVKGYSDLPTKSRKDWGQISLDNMTAWLDQVGTDPKMETFKEANAHLWGAPAMAYITIPKTAPVWSVYDAGGFAQTLMLAAASRGLDSMVAYENVRYPDEIRDHLPISDDEMIVAGDALGYRSPAAINDFVSQRSDLDDILVIR